MKMLLLFGFNGYDEATEAPIFTRKSFNDSAMSILDVLSLFLYINLEVGKLFILDTLIRLRIPSQVFLTLLWFCRKKNA